MINLYASILMSLMAALSFTLDSAQIAIKLKSAEFNSAILGSHVGQVLLLINRALIALSLLIIGFLVDSKFGISNLILIYSLTAFLTTIFHLFLLSNSRIRKITLFLLRVIHKKQVYLNNLDYKHVSKFGFWPLLSFVTFLTFFGFFGPSIFAVALYDYRATLMQTSFIFNTAATLMYVLIVEKKMAIVMDLGDIELINTLRKNFLNTRIYSFAFQSLLLLMLYFYLDKI